jgi:hypothetical protein
MGAVPGLPHHVIGRPAVARPTPQCRSDQPNPGAIVPILPAQCAVRNTLPAGRPYGMESDRNPGAGDPCRLDDSGLIEHPVRLG